MYKKNITILSILYFSYIPEFFTINFTNKTAIAEYFLFYLNRWDAGRLKKIFGKFDRFIQPEM